MLKMRRTSRALYGSLGESTPALEFVSPAPMEALPEDDGETLRDSQLDGEEIQLIESGGAVRLRLQPGGAQKSIVSEGGSKAWSPAVGSDFMFADTLVDAAAQTLPPATEARHTEVAYADTLLDVDVEPERLNCPEALWYTAAGEEPGTVAEGAASSSGPKTEGDPVQAGPSDNLKAFQEHILATDHKARAGPASVVVLDAELDTGDAGDAATVRAELPEAVGDAPVATVAGFSCSGGLSTHELPTVPAASQACV